MLGFELKGKERKRVQASNRLTCMQACLSEREFDCRSANFDTESGDCSMSDLDRASIVPTHDMKMRTYGPSSGSVEYIESNCLEGRLRTFVLTREASVALVCLVLSCLLFK